MTGKIPRMPPRVDLWRGWLIPLLLILLALALRLHLLGAQSLWNDEGNSYIQATRSLSEIAAHAARDIHPPGYYWLLHIWLRLAGQTEFALRMLSVWASVLTVAFTLVLGRRLYGRLAGYAAALFVALNSFSLYYAQETRMYALLALWGVAGMWALVGALQQRQPRRWLLALLLINTAGLWTQYAYPFFMLVQGIITVIALVGRWRSGVAVGRWLLAYTLANVAMLILYLPWLPVAISQLTTWPSTGQPVPLAVALQMLLGWFAFGITYLQTDTSWAAVVLLLLLLALRLETPRRAAWRVLLPVLWVIVPVGLFLALSMFREQNIKLLLPAQIGFALWLGRGLQVLAGLRLRYDWQRYAVWLAIVAVVAGLTVNLWRGLNPLYHDGAYQRDNYRGVAQMLSAELTADDAIILDAPNQAEVFHYYYKGAAPVLPLPPGLGGDDAATQAEVVALIGRARRISAVLWGEAERDPNRIVETTLNQQAFAISSAWYGDIRLVQYVTPVNLTVAQDTDVALGEHITLVRYALNNTRLLPGDVLQLRLDWLTDAPLSQRYKVFVQVLDAQGQLVAQRDSEPGGGQALTITWPVDTPIEDNHALILPADMPTGTYQLIVGLYDSDHPQQRLSTATGDYITLTAIEVLSKGEG